MRFRAHWIALLFFAFVSAASADDPLEEIVERTYPLDAQGTISLRNAGGVVQIYGSEKPELKLRASKHAYTADRLHAISIDVQATTDSIAIETKVPAGKHTLDLLRDRSGTVDYLLVVPMKSKISRVELDSGEVLLSGLRGGSARVHVNNGWIAAQNCFANLNLNLHNGRLEIDYDWSEERRFSLDARAENASFRALLPPDHAFAIRAKAENGRVEDRSSLIKQPTSISDTGVIDLATKNGNIYLEKRY